MKVLIAGFGFIGRYVAELLLQQGHEVGGVNREVGVIDNRHDAFDDPPAGVQIHQGDIRDRDWLHWKMSKYDAIINLAGLLGTSELMDNAINAVDNNITGALNIFNGCRMWEAQRKVPYPCVQITVGNHFMDNPYSITKSTVERFAKMYNVEHKTSIRVVRALNAYGPRQKHKPIKKIIPNFVRSALFGEPIKVYGDGEQIMDMIYVGDVAKILVAALDKAPGDNLIISAGTGRSTTVNQIANWVIAAAQSSSKVEHLPMRPGEPERSVVLGEPVTLSAIGFNCADLTPFEQGIQQTVAWYKDNQKIFGD